MPSWLRGQRGADRARVQHRPADVDAVVDAREHEVGLGADGPEAPAMTERAGEASSP